ncbi:ubiquitin-conjugating enzyme E2 U-like isoform X2 [Littorina saxatilis]|uniref:UBC core domain-containing protein n=1 Tax=Littorina saxatilis TaxID=31220 RepID=A0AAN9GAU5_9CAEN
MLSRPHLLIEKEIQKLKSTPPWGVNIEPVSDDSVFEWLAKISGLRDTIWEGGIFQIYIRFDEHFNIRPPEVYFQTIPFHPNVDMRTGRPCVDYLDNLDLWRPGFSLSMLLVSLQALLSNPNLNHAINNEAIEMMSLSPNTYRQMVLECVTASQRIEAGGSPQLEDTKVKFATIEHYPPAPRTASVKRPTKLSFDDYHMTWRSIATSKPTENADNPLLEALQNKPALQAVHMALPPEEVEEQMKNQKEEHKELMFGRFHNKLTFSQEQDAKLARLRRMQKIYLPTRRSSTPTEDIMLDPVAAGMDGREWEKEVDDLVSWSNNLDTATIDT